MTKKTKIIIVGIILFSLLLFSKYWTDSFKVYDNRRFEGSHGNGDILNF